jgi:hypothetical protein
MTHKTVNKSKSKDGYFLSDDRNWGDVVFNREATPRIRRMKLTWKEFTDFTEIVPETKKKQVYHIFRKVFVKASEPVILSLTQRSWALLDKILCSKEVSRSWDQR